jgi:hypothetical protein
MDDETAGLHGRRFRVEMLIRFSSGALKFLVTLRE